MARQRLQHSETDLSINADAEAFQKRKRTWRYRCRKHLQRIRKEHQRQLREGFGHPFPPFRRIVLSPAFDYFVNFVIIANCVFIGVQADSKEPLGSMGQVAEHAFTACFFTDLIIRILGNGWTWLLDSENYLDIGLVLLSVMVSWTPIGDHLEVLRKLTVLRTLRLVRLARAVKNRPEFKEMWALLKGLVDSTETLCWTYVMICLLLYFFAIMATSLIGKQDAFADNEMVQDYFGDVPRAMLTLFQIMTLDSWSSLCRSIMKGQQIWIAFFFIVFITVAEFVLMNLITAVIVENAFSDSRTEDQELAKRLAAKKEEEMEELKRFFMACDEDGSGLLSKEELHSAAQKRKIRQKLRALDVMPKDIDELWEILDDGDGQLTPEEFINGLQRLRGEAKAKDVLRLYRELRILEASIAEVNFSLDTSQERMQVVKNQLVRAKVDIAAMQRTVARAREVVKVAAHTQPLSK